MIFVVAVLTGILLGLLVPYNLSSSTLPYVAVAIIAALDSVFGGLAAYLNKRFNMSVFMIGLVSNAVLAVFLTFVGDVLGINLYFAAIVVFGVRMFNNMGTIRRMTIDVHFERRARAKRNVVRAALRAAEDEDEETSDNADDNADGTAANAAGDDSEETDNRNSDEKEAPEEEGEVTKEEINSEKKEGNTKNTKKGE